MSASPRILIIQTAFIGDVILATSLVESIKSQLPEALIDFVVRKGNESLLANNPGLRRIFIHDKSRKYSSLRALTAEFRREKYDYLINVQRFATTGLMTVMSGATMTIGYEKNPFSFLFSKKITHAIGSVHEVTRNLSLLAPLGIQSSARPKVYPSPDQWSKVKAYKSEPYITVSPASVWFTKQLPADQWTAFLSRVDHRKVFLLGGPDDRERCESIITKLPGKSIVNLAGTLSLLESAALMADARMNFVNDSAPLHLASAMNAPVTAVFCSTVPDFGFGPLSDRSVVVETKEALDCRPCGLHGYRQCPKGHFRCATSITTDQLMTSLD